jgi:hypothetical protein
VRPADRLTLADLAEELRVAQRIVQLVSDLAAARPQDAAEVMPSLARALAREKAAGQALVAYCTSSGRAA